MAADDRRPGSPLTEAEGAAVVRRSAERARSNPDRRAASPVAASLPALPPPAAGPARVEVDPDERERRLRVGRLLADSGVPELYAAADLTDLSRVPEAVAARYAEAVRLLLRLEDAPAIVALLGSRGPGKTHMSCGLVRRFCLAGRPAKYMDAMDYFVAVKETFGRDAKLDQSQVEGRLLKPDLLVIDEVHERGDTPWEDRMLTRLVNKRYVANRATVLVSNQTPKAFKDRVGPSIADRLHDRGGRVVTCEWPSLRGCLTGGTHE